MKGPTGIICPIVTPFVAGEHLDQASFRAQVRRLLPEVDGLLIAGTTGEAAVLQASTIDAMLDIVAEEAAGSSVDVILGIGDTGTTRVTARLRSLHPVVGSVMVCTPYYYAHTQAALRAHYLDVAERSPVPVVLYNIPQNTYNPLTVDTVADLTAHPNIVGIKDSTGDLDHFRRLHQLADEGFAVVQGAAERHAADMFRAGVDGFASGISNIEPGVLRRLRDAVAASDTAREAELMQRVDAMCALLEQGFWLSAMKTAVALIVGGNGAPAAPTNRSTPEEATAIRSILRKLELIPEFPFRERNADT